MTHYRTGDHDRRVLADNAADVTRSGKYGTARVLVESCLTVRAEDVYTLLVECGVSLRPGANGTLPVVMTRRRNGESVEVSTCILWECRANNGWHFGGRVFLLCPECRARCTRLYEPLEDAGFRCRVCWGLSYWSRVHNNYRPGSAHGVPHRAWARLASHSAREQRSEASWRRWKRRREARGFSGGSVRGATAGRAQGAGLPAFVAQTSGKAAGVPVPRRVGRRRKFSDAGELQAAVDAYFAACDLTGRPYTLTGLAVALDTSRQTLWTHAGENPARPDFADPAIAAVLAMARARCAEYTECALMTATSRRQVAGLIFVLKHNYGWR